MTDRKSILLQAVLAGGYCLKRFFGKVGVAQSRAKSGVPVNLVSRADIEAQRVIIGKIRRHFPKDAVLAEEEEWANLERPTAENLWVIDPLDGTINFLHGLPLFAVSVAFYKNDQPVIGATFDPIREELFWAEKGRGAYLKTRSHFTKKLKVTSTLKLSDALMITGFGYDRRKRADFYLSYYRSFLQITHDVRRTGSACIDLAWISAGRADGFWEWKLKPWDVAVGKLLVEEAGGRITHFDGRPYSIFKSDQTLATNGLIHAQCLKVVHSLKLEA